MIDYSQTCRWCGQRTTESSYASGSDGVFCCEGCFLGYMSQQHSLRERDASQLALVEALAAALDARERETGMHSKRVACHTQVLAHHFSQDDDWLQQVYWGALLHDIGKIAIPDTVLLKEGPLSEEESSATRARHYRWPSLYGEGGGHRALSRGTHRVWPVMTSPGLPVYFPLSTPWMP